MRRVRMAILAAIMGAAPAALAQPTSAPPPAGPHVEAPGKLPEAPRTVPDLAYDSRVLASAAAAEQFQGPLDGAWILASTAKGELYGLELVDKQDRLEGAWRDLRRPGLPDASGVIDQVQRTPTGVELRFAPKGQAEVRVSLKRDLTGEMEQAGLRTAVAMKKDPKTPITRR